MDNLPEDQQRNDSPPSSPEPEGVVADVGLANQVEQVQQIVQDLNIQQAPEIPIEHNALLNQQQQPLLLRHASVSSLDESSQKYRERCDFSQYL